MRSAGAMTSGGGESYSVTVNVNGSMLGNIRQIEEAVVAGLESAKNRGRVNAQVLQTGAPGR